MKSDLPKVLARASGRPLIDYVLDALEAVGITRTIVVVGYRAADVEAAIGGRPGIAFALQSERRGTGHAVMMCRSQIEQHRGPIVIVAGDSPMLQASSLSTLLADFRERPAACVMGTLIHPSPAGLGRILRNERGQFVGIVEEKDATPEQRAIQEVNMSTYVFDCPRLVHSLDRLTNDNRQREYYITDVPGILLRDGFAVRALPVLKPCEAFSVNTVDDLAAVESELQRRHSGECAN
jgi:bifunctional UDP-N-acetylglucosamine pyrophosphorylase/glucosamine-1-phosphate N-acetyltransferase/UDP-N-acetylglucosamine pyrophosphorylase